MSRLIFELPEQQRVEVTVSTLVNAGYAGRSQDDVKAHVVELAKLGVPAPRKTPCMYPIAPYLAMQADEVSVQHAHTSGEAEWALIVAGTQPDDILLTAACDHTDRKLERHGVAWSKQAGPDVFARTAWRLVDVESRIDQLTLTGQVRTESGPRTIQQGTLGELLTPSYWLDVLATQGLLRPGTVLLSGTIPMDAEVDQFSDWWRVALGDPVTGRSISVEYSVRQMPEPID